MPPLGTNRPSAAAAATFFPPRSNTRRENRVEHDYNNIERNEVNPIATPGPNKPPPGDPNYEDSDNEEDTIIVDVPAPEFANTNMTEAEKMEAILKWTETGRSLRRRRVINPARCIGICTAR